MGAILRSIGLLGSGLLLIAFLFSLPSCVYDKEFTYLNDQIVALNKRVSKLEATLGGDLDARLEAIHSRQAEVGVEIDVLRGEIDRLSGRVEDNEGIIKRVVERDLDKEDAMREGLAALTEKVSELEVLVRRQREHLGLKVPALKEGPEAAKRPPRPEKLVPGRPVPVEEPKSRELALYDAAMASFKEGKYDEAMEGFKTLLKTYPQSDRADNAQFWIGECYMALKKYEQAILAYQEVIKKYPGGNKVPGAMLKQAIAFLEIKDKTSTRLLLKKIMEKYPDSSEAKIAQKKLETLK